MDAQCGPINWTVVVCKSKGSRSWGPDDRYLYLLLNSGDESIRIFHSKTKSEEAKELEQERNLKMVKE
jgi:hypothetical protein